MLEEVLKLPITAGNTGIRQREHIGPMAEVFHRRLYAAAGPPSLYRTSPDVHASGMLTTFRRMFRPQRIALIGASDQPESIGQALTAQVLSVAGITVYLVNRHRHEVYGQGTLAQADELPDGIDLAIVMTPWASVPDIVATLGRKHCAGAVVLSLAAAGGVLWDSSRMLLYRLRRQLRRSPIRIIGPASQGLLLPRLHLNLSLCARLPPPGHIAFLATSPAITDFFADWAANHGVGASLIAGLGDAVDLDLPILLDWLARDEQSRAVLVYLDRLVDPRALLSAARAVARSKPLVVLVDPQLARAAVTTGDTGLPAYDPADLLRSALERAGALMVDNLEQLCAAANVDLPAWPHAGSRFAVLGNTPELGALAAQAIQRSGGLLARLERSTERTLRPLLPPAAGAVRNPFDLKRNADGARYAAAIAALRSDPNVDVVLALHHANTFTASTEIAAVLEPSASGSAPLLLSLVGGGRQQTRLELAQRGIATFATPDQAVAAYTLNRRYFQLRHELQLTPPPLLEDELPPMAVLKSLRSLDLPRAARAQQLCAALGIELLPPLPGVAADEAPALGLASDVRLGPFAWWQPAATSPVRATLLPLDRLRVARLLRPEAAAPLDEGLLQLLKRALLKLALLLPHWPELHAVRLRRLALDAEGALCGELAIEHDPDRIRPPFAFLPPPSEPYEVVTARDGMRMLLRPIRAEDEPRLTAGFTRLSPEEVRMRFLFPLKQLTHELAARLTQLDYDRELALVLASFEPPGQSELFSVVRASMDVLEQSAEFAIVIPRQLAGQGLGTLLMERILSWCSARGLRSVYGDVLAENAAMLGLARKLGFSERPMADESGVIRVERRLR